MNNGCQAGCKVFTGGEVKHHPDCQYYPESFSKLYDDLRTEVKKLRKSSVVRSLPTDEEIRAQALITVNDGDSDTGKIIHRAAFETGARWMKEKLSGQ